MTDVKNDPDLGMYFDFLDDLRESGVTNMFGARPYLEDEYELGRKEARAILTLWMKSFHFGGSPAHRAEQARHLKI